MNTDKSPKNKGKIFGNQEKSFTNKGIEIISDSSRLHTGKESQNTSIINKTNDNFLDYLDKSDTVSERSANGGRKSIGRNKSDNSERMKDLSREISKNVTAALKKTNEKSFMIHPTKNSITILDEKRPQRTTCQHCLMLKRQFVVPKSVDEETCPIHRDSVEDNQAHQEDYSPLKTPDFVNKKKRENNISLGKMELIKVPKKDIPDEITSSRENNSASELENLLNETEKELYEKNEQLKRLTNENKSLKDQMEYSQTNKDHLAQQLYSIKIMYEGAMDAISALMDIILDHLRKNLIFYDDLHLPLSQEKNGKNESFKKNIDKLKVENLEITKRIHDKIWERFDPAELKKRIDELLSDRDLNLLIISLKNENYLHEDKIEKLINYQNELESQIKELAEGKNLNKNNILKILQLTKDSKDSSLRETQLLQTIKELAKQVEDMTQIRQRPSIQGSQAANQRIAELEDKLKKMTAKFWDASDIETNLRQEIANLKSRLGEFELIDDDNKDHVDDLAIVNKNLEKISKLASFDPVLTPNESLIGSFAIPNSPTKDNGIQDAIRQLSLIIISKDGSQMSDEAKKLIKEVFPKEIAKNIAQWEERIRDLEDQNGRLLEELKEEQIKGSTFARNTVILIDLIYEQLNLYEDNSGIKLPTDFKSYHNGLLMKKPLLDQIYQECVELSQAQVNDSRVKASRESILLGRERFAMRESIGYPSEPPMFGYVDASKNKKFDQDENEVITSLKLEIDELKSKIELQQSENFTLSMQLKIARDREINLEKNLSEVRTRNDLFTKNKKSDTRSDQILSNSLQISPRPVNPKSMNKSLNSSFTETAPSESNKYNTDAVIQKITNDVDFIMLLHLQSQVLEKKIRNAPLKTLDFDLNEDQLEKSEESRIERVTETRQSDINLNEDLLDKMKAIDLQVSTFKIESDEDLLNKRFSLNPGF